MKFRCNFLTLSSGICVAGLIRTHGPQSGRSQRAACGQERMKDTQRLWICKLVDMQGIMVYPAVAVTCPHILNNVLTCHRSAVSPLAAPLAPPVFQWCHGSMVFLFVLACVSAHTVCVGEIKEAGTERRTSTSLSTPEADSCVYHASAAAHLGTISLVFANFLFRPLVCGAGPRGVTVCAERCITGSLACHKVMSVMSWITIQRKSWWTESFSRWPQHNNEINTFGTFCEWRPSCTSFIEKECSGGECFRLWLGGKICFVLSMNESDVKCFLGHFIQMKNNTPKILKSNFIKIPNIPKKILI